VYSVASLIGTIIAGIVAGAEGGPGMGVLVALGVGVPVCCSLLIYCHVRRQW